MFLLAPYISVIDHVLSLGLKLPNESFLGSRDSPHLAPWQYRYFISTIVVQALASLWVIVDCKTHGSLLEPVLLAGASMDDRRKSQQTLGQSLLEANNGQQQDGRVHAVHPHPARLADNTHQHTLTHRRVGQCWPSSNGMKDRTTSVSTILHRMATGDPISAGGEQWKLTRAVVHLDDSWKGRVNPCPALDNERVLGLVKLRWRLRQLDFLLVHLLMALSLVETPSWCLKNRECFWTCYPDFSRNWHMDPESASITECCMLGILIVIALIDMVRIESIHFILVPLVVGDPSYPPNDEWRL